MKTGVSSCQNRVDSIFLQNCRKVCADILLRRGRAEESEKDWGSAGREGAINLSSKQPRSTVRQMGVSRPCEPVGERESGREEGSTGRPVGATTVLVQGKFYCAVEAIVVLISHCSAHQPLQRHGFDLSLAQRVHCLGWWWLLSIHL